jgi:hypothetical protein
VAAQYGAEGAGGGVEEGGVSGSLSLSLDSSLSPSLSTLQMQVQSSGCLTDADVVCEYP